MKPLFLRELELTDETEFLEAMQRSKSFYDLWMSAPMTHEQFIEFYNKYNQSNHKSYLLLTSEKNITGVFNLSEIVRGLFQNNENSEK